MTKIKILYTIPNFDTAGSGKVLYDLAKYLDKDKFEVSIACDSKKGSFYKEVEALELPIFIIQTTVPLRPYYSFLSRLQPLKQFIKENQFNIVHSWHWSSDWTEVLGAKLGGAKFVFTKKAMSWGNLHWKIRSFLSDFIVTINEEMKNYFPNKKAQKLIPIGIDLDYYNSTHFPTNKDSNYFNIISVANLVPVKGIEVLIDAVCTLDNPKIKLSILGDNNNEYGEKLQEKVNVLGKQEQIVFLGKHKDVRPFLVNSDLILFDKINKFFVQPKLKKSKNANSQCVIKSFCIDKNALRKIFFAIHLDMKNKKMYF